MTSSDSSDFYQNFNGSYFDDLNFYFSGIISLIFNNLLIYVISRIKSYTSPVKYSMYSMALLRLLFSISIALSCPTIVYSKNINSLYILKNGINFSNGIGYIFLSLFVSFMVMSCNGPAVQYLQASFLISLSQQNSIRKSITICPFLVVFASLFLIFFGYIPPLYEIRISSFIRKLLEEQGDTPFLIITVRLTYDSTKNSNTFQFLSQTCTFFILIIMFISILTVIICTVYIQKQMRIRFVASSASKKAQEQLNMALLLQFILPFITIHIPFYIIVILPFFGIAGRLLSDRVLFLFCWCPAINPILVIFLVKKIRTELLPCQNKKKSQGPTRSIAVVFSM